MDDENEALWNAVYEARYQCVENKLGELPPDILKIMHLSGTWPGGGLYKFNAAKLSDDLWVYMTFGLTNPDMPTSFCPKEIEVENENGLPSRTQFTLEKKKEVPSYPDRCGYGYELMVVTRGEEEWPLWFLQWAVEAELMNDVDILGRVENYNGLTVEDINVGDNGAINVLFQKAQNPFPCKLSLPTGQPSLIIATSITDDEMLWSRNYGRDKLFEKLGTSGVGQISDINRASILHPEGVDYSAVNSREKAAELAEAGLLRKVQLFPLEFGGEDVEQNTIYLPKKAAIEKLRFEQRVMDLAQSGLINSYTASPDYQGDSYIPSDLRLEASGNENVAITIQIF